MLGEYRNNDGGITVSGKAKNNASGFNQHGQVAEVFCILNFSAISLNS